MQTRQREELCRIWDVMVDGNWDLLSANGQLEDAPRGGQMTVLDHLRMIQKQMHQTPINNFD